MCDDFAKVAPDNWPVAYQDVYGTHVPGKKRINGKWNHFVMRIVYLFN
jgi:hypothetical protein